MLCASPPATHCCVPRSLFRTREMANPLTIEIFRVEHGGGFSMPRITLANRRAGGAVPRMVHWICQRHLETLLYGRVDGGSSGAMFNVSVESSANTVSIWARPHSSMRTSAGSRVPPPLIPGFPPSPSSVPPP